MRLNCSAASTCQQFLGKRFHIHMYIYLCKYEYISISSEHMDGSWRTIRTLWPQACCEINYDSKTHVKVVQSCCRCAQLQSDNSAPRKMATWKSAGVALRCSGGGVRKAKWKLKLKTRIVSLQRLPRQLLLPRLIEFSTPLLSNTAITSAPNAVHSTIYVYKHNIYIYL